MQQQQVAYHNVDDSGIWSPWLGQVPFEQSTWSHQSVSNGDGYGGGERGDLMAARASASRAAHYASAAAGAQSKANGQHRRAVAKSGGGGAADSDGATTTSSDSSRTAQQREQRALVVTDGGLNDVYLDDEDVTVDQFQ